MKDIQSTRASETTLPKDVDKPVLGMILKGFPRISETFISNEILLLEKHGLRIRLFSMRHPRESFAHESVRAIKATVDYLPQTILEGFFTFLYHNGRLALKYPRRYWKAIKLAGRRFRRTRKSATFKHLLQAGYIVNKLLPGSGVVHMHAHFAHSPASVALFVSILSGIDFSFTAHAKDIYTSDPRQLKEKITAARFVVTCTRYNQRYLKALGASGQTHIYCIYHGIDLALFNHRDLPREPRAPYRLMTIARIVPKKGLATVYQALDQLKRNGIDFEHTLIGDGDDRRTILELIHELGLESHCRWLGTLPHEDVLEAFRRSDLFILGCRLASNGDRDGIPNVFMESMAMGVPVVATDVSAIPELITHEATGLLVPSEDPQAMAGAVMRLLTDLPLRSRIITAARERVTRHFDNHVLAGALVDIYRREQPKLFVGPPTLP